MANIAPFDYPDEEEALATLGDDLAESLAFEEMFPPAPAFLSTVGGPGSVYVLGLRLYLNAGVLYGKASAGVGDLAVSYETVGGLGYLSAA